MTNFRFKEDLDNNLGTLRNEMNFKVISVSTLIRLLSLNDIYPSTDLLCLLRSFKESP